MQDSDIFEELFGVCKLSKDPEGVVAACLVKNGKIILASPSADDGIRHAEDLLLEKVKRENISLNSVTLYTTLEPCSYRNPQNKVLDCTTIIIKSGIKNVVFAAPDPEFSKDSRRRFHEVGVNYRKIENKDITKKAIEIFNNSIEIPLTSMHLPRVKKLPK